MHGSIWGIFIKKILCNYKKVSSQLQKKFLHNYKNNFFATIKKSFSQL